MSGFPESFDHGYGVSHTDHDSFSSSVHVRGKTVKKFKGESAWSDAQRHAGDLATKARYSDTDIFNDRRGPQRRGSQFDRDQHDRNREGGGLTDAEIGMEDRRR
jgi:hypothetical protein